jgi:flagellar FliL protein
MKKLLLPILMIIIGVGGGAAAGFFLKSASEVATENPPECIMPDAGVAPVPDTGPVEYVKINNQFVIPVLRSGQVAALVVLSLSVEVTAGQKDVVYEREPKLRDVFNEVLFLHANVGGFDGVFTDTLKMNSLRRGLSEAAAGVLGPISRGILVTDIVRQDA